MEHTIYGYARVSSTDQNEDRQMLALSKLKSGDLLYMWRTIADKICRRIPAFWN